MEHFNFMFKKILCSLLISIIFVKKLSVAAADTYTLVPNQTLVIGQTLISQNQVIAMGFFQPGKSSNRFLGIWYKSTPDAVVWVANTNNPITASQGVAFAISRNGSLVISSGGSTIWSEAPSRIASNPVLRLLDTGNLVVADDDEAKQGYLWQSFDHPTNNWLPGLPIVSDAEAGVERYLTSWKSAEDPSPGDYVLKIENHALPEMVIYKGKTKTYRTGKWNGKNFSSFPSFPSSIFRADLVFRDGRLISAAMPYNTSLFTRSELDQSGYIQRYTMNSQQDEWNHVYTFPQDRCDQYGYCGTYAICRIENAQRCECLKGFAPKFPNDWDLQSWSGGCTRIKPVNCEGGDDFLEVRGVKHPDMLVFSLNGSMSLAECKDQCLRNCNCTAFANPYLTDNGGSGCVMWLGDLIDIRELPGADGNRSLYVRLPISELGDTTDRGKNKEEEKQTKRRRRPLKLIVILVASGVLFAGLIAGVILLMTRGKRPASKVNNEYLELPLFKFATIMAATKEFSTENFIGEGGFGPVYKGTLSSGVEIAIKRLSRTSQQGLNEFKNEVTLIAKLQHRNLVRLLGCCIEGDERMLIYEYLHNKSLNYFLYDDYKKTLLTWPTRFEIIMGIARGLLYLHHDSRLKIVHRDLKTSNILLDQNLNPKISDFGLARIFEEEKAIARTRRVIGTYGYMAPEYAIDGKFSVKSDIFSLGVVLLEIVSGKKNRGFDHSNHNHTLLGHAWLLWKEKKIVEVMDECLNDTFVESQVKRCMQVGLLCVQKFVDDRPTMPSVVSMLGSDGAILPEPKEPGFFIERSSSKSTSPRSERETFTITDLEAR